MRNYEYVTEHEQTTRSARRQVYYGTAVSHDARASTIIRALIIVDFNEPREKSDSPDVVYGVDVWYSWRTACCAPSVRCSGALMVVF